MGRLPTTEALDIVTVSMGANAMQCPKCGSEDVGVKDSRPAEFRGRAVIRRKRRCKHCGEMWPTIEVGEALMLQIMQEILSEMEEAAIRKRVTKIINLAVAFCENSQ